MSGVGAFLTGVIDGAERRRDWDRQKKKDKWDEEDRGWKREDRIEDKKARAVEADWTKYERSQIKDADAREADARRAAADAYDATVDSFDGTASEAAPETQAPSRPRLALPRDTAANTPEAPTQSVPGAPALGATPGAMPPPAADQSPQRRSLPDAAPARSGAPALASPPLPGTQPAIAPEQANRFQQAVEKVHGKNLTPQLAMEADRAEAAIASGMNPVTRQPLNAYEVEELQNVVRAAEDRLRMDAGQFEQPRIQAPDGPYPPVEMRDGAPMSEQARSRMAERRAIVQAARAPRQTGMDVPMQDTGPNVAPGNLDAARTAETARAQGRVAADQGAPTAPSTATDRPSAMPRQPRMMMAPQDASPDAPVADTRTVTPGQIAASGDPKALDSATGQTQAQPVPPSVTAVADAATGQGRTISLQNAPPAKIERAKTAARTDFMTQYGKVGAPKMVEFYLKSGEPEKAAAYQQFVERSETKAAMKSWADAVFYASIGDDDRFVDGLTEAYNARGYFDDGYEAVRNKSGITRDQNANVVGATITFRDIESGKEFTQELDSVQDLYQMGVHMLSPEQVFEQGWARVKQAEERQAAIIDYTRKQQDKGRIPDQQRLKDAMDLLADADISFAQLPMEEQVAQAWAYAMRYDDQGNLKGGLPTQPAGQPASQPAAPREVPRY